MRVELPSKNWVELRDKLYAADKFAVQEAVVLTVSDDRAQKVTGGIQNAMRNALLRQIITSWSFSVAIPSDPRMPGDIGSTLDLDDYNVLEEAVEPLLQKVSFAPNRTQPAS